MEIIFFSPDSIKIKGKSASIMFDPETKADADIVIFTKESDLNYQEKVSKVRLIISGPGEYEVGGMSISGKKAKNGIIFTIIDTLKIVVINSNSAGELSEDEEYDAVVINVVDKFSDELLGPVNTKTVLIYGNTALATIKSENCEKTRKVNLKKTSDIQGKTFLLS